MSSENEKIDELIKTNQEQPFFPDEIIIDRDDATAFEGDPCDAIHAKDDDFEAVYNGTGQLSLSKSKDKECGGCGSDAIYRKITLTDKDGVVLDTLNICLECWNKDVRKLVVDLGLYEGDV